jgi:hypothetical protein
MAPPAAVPWQRLGGPHGSEIRGLAMTRKSTPVANPNSHREMLGQSPELHRPYLWTIGLQAVGVAFSGVAWFVAVMWLNFVGRPQLGPAVVIVTGMLVMFLTLVLLAISKVIDDPQWRLPHAFRASTTRAAGSITSRTRCISASMP